jgi:hypothetical protein
MMGRGYKAGSGQFAMSSTGRKIYEQGGTEFVKSRIASLNNLEVVEVSVSKLDALWKENKSFYIPKGGGGAEIKGRRQEFREFRKKDKPIEMSQVHVRKDGSFGFADGRHRFSVFRDEGRKTILVTTERGAAANRLKKLAGIKRGKKRK